MKPVGSALAVPAILCVVLAFSCASGPSRNVRANPAPPGTDDDASWSSFPDPGRGTVQPGYIVTASGQRIDGYLLNINLWLNQHMTYFYKDPADPSTRVRYGPKDLLAYRVGNRLYESMRFMFVYSTNANNFILRKQNGRMRYFVWYYDRDRSRLASPAGITASQLLQAFVFDEKDLWKSEWIIHDGGELKELGGFDYALNFAKVMSALVADDRELADRIRRKEPGYLNIHVEKIVAEYNRRNP